MLTEEQFNIIARGELPMLMAAFRCERGAQDQAGVVAIKTPHVQEDTDFVLLGSLWPNLLVQLSHTAQECARPDTILRRKAFGMRKRRMVTLSLVREYARSHEIASDSGFTISQQEVLCLTHQLSPRDDLDHDFRVLAELYELLLLTMQPRTNGQVFRWLKGRAQVHFAQAESIREGT